MAAAVQVEKLDEERKYADKIREMHDQKMLGANRINSYYTVILLIEDF